MTKTIRLCITGGSGFIGTHAVNWALNLGISVINFDIKPPKIHTHLSNWRFLDIRDGEKLSREILSFNPTHILHLAAVTGMDIKDISIFDANICGVENIIRAASCCNHLERIIFTSSLLVCMNGFIPKFDTEYCPPNLYGESKVIGEKLVRSYGRSLPWVIVRPTSVWGPWFEESYLTFFKLLRRGLYFQPGSAPVYKPLSYVGNIVHMMMTILFRRTEDVNFQTYYLADYPQISIHEWADIIRASLNKPKTPIAPLYLLKIIAKFGDFMKYSKLTSDPPLTSFRLKNMITGANYDIDKTAKIIGVLPHSIEDGVKSTLVWMDLHNL